MAARVAAARVVFDEIDTDGDGSLSQEELAALLLKLGSDAGEEGVADLMRELDEDGDGEVDFFEPVARLKRQTWKPSGHNSIIYTCLLIHAPAQLGTMSWC